jgi:hypothetical protein
MESLYTITDKKFTKHVDECSFIFIIAEEIVFFTLEWCVFPKFNLCTLYAFGSSTVCVIFNAWPRAEFLKKNYDCSARQ